MLLAVGVVVGVVAGAGAVAGEILLLLLVLLLKYLWSKERRKETELGEREAGFLTAILRRIRWDCERRRRRVSEGGRTIGSGGNRLSPTAGRGGQWKRCKPAK